MTRHRWKPNVTVAAVIEQDGRFMLVEEETSAGLMLNTPAGHLDPGESPLEGCAREALEETAHRFTPTALRDAIAESLKEYIADPTVTVIVVETQPQTVSVMGEVGTPGVLPLKHQMTVLDALAAAGGFRDFANTKDILIKRNTKTGVQTLRFNYKDAIKSDAKPFYLQPGDIIIVP